jgi:hypothetical protein
LAELNVLSVNMIDDADEETGANAIADTASKTTLDWSMSYPPCGFKLILTCP